MSNRITFDPSEDPTPEMVAAEQAALEQGEKLISAQNEDRARKFEADEAQNEDVNLIGGKFKSQDDLLKAYEELQKKLSKPEEATDEEPEGEVDPTQGGVDEEEVTEEVEEEEKPVDENIKTFVEISSRFNENGGLTEADMETLVNMDQRSLVETYFKYLGVENQKAQAAMATQSEMKAIRDSVGGDEAYASMIQWAGDNLGAKDIAQFNDVVQTNNAAAIRYAVESLNNKYRAAEGYEAPLVTGKKATSKAKGFRSQAELARAIADPRYSQDPAYRQDVEEKLARSGDLL